MAHLRVLTLPLIGSRLCRTFVNAYGTSSNLKGSELKPMHEVSELVTDQMQPAVPFKHLSILGLSLRVVIRGWSREASQPESHA